jgi:hypothetical protein
MENKPNFCLNHIKTLSPIDARRYIDEYFIPLTSGDHAFYINGKYEIYDDSVVNKTYFKRMTSEIKKYYFEEKTDLRTITYDINKPVLYDTSLNLCPKIKQSYKPYNEFDDTIKAKVNIMLNHINEVLCSSNKDSYNFVIKWFANMIKGNRNNSCLYLKGVQGAGKSTPLEFIREHVIGKDLAYQGGSGPLKTKFNSELSGKLMVVFEELENFGSSEWISISCILKRQITSPTLQIEAKGKDVREETNLNNYILASNNDCIQDDDGRRYYILDISTKYVKNEDYFNRLYTCFNDEVGQAFYSYLYEIDTDKFNPQSYPKTQSKLDSYSKRLDNVYKFIKDEYILKKQHIDRISVSDFYQNYASYCSSNGITKPKTKIDFNNTLKNINIDYYKSNGTNYYKVSLEQLTDISNKFNWVHDLDEYKQDKQENNLDRDFIDYEELYKKQTDEIHDLKEQIKKLTESQHTIISIGKTSKPKKTNKVDKKFIVDL